MKITFLAFLTFFAAPALAETPDDIIKKSKLGSDACLAFVDATAVEFRTQRWLAAIRKMDKSYVMKWISGQEKPPSLAIKESVIQRDCLIRRISQDAAEGELIVDGAGVSANPAGMKKLEARTKKNVKKVARNLIRSHYRAASTQSSIWRRKFVFSGRNFNLVSPVSAKRCGLKSGESWKPNVKKHRLCWKAMSGEDREKEILLASSAPGISRHHWGTDFDIFGLNPRLFYPGRKLYDEYIWMNKNAIEFGVVQPYSSTSQKDGMGYMEERWHWSYHPIAGALSEFAQENETDLEKELDAQWDGLTRRWGKRKKPYFGYVRTNWRSFVFNVDTTALKR